MATDVTVPPFPESVEEGTLTTWHKQAGDAVKRNERLADIETDKIVLEVAAQADGVLTDVAVQEGASVSAGQVLARLDAAAVPAAAEQAASQTPQQQDAESNGGNGTAAPTPTPAPAPQDAATAEVAMSPAVRRMVEEHGIDPSQVTGTGRKGMITKADVLAFLKDGGGSETDGASTEPAQPTQPAQPTIRPQTAAAIAATEKPKPAAQVAPDALGRPEERVPMTRIRARIAERLVEAQQTAAILTTFNEVNMQPVMDLRNRHKAAFEKAYGVKLGFMSFFVKAAADALRAYPIVNATLDGSDIIYHGYFDIGVAVSTERGLVVPILRNADQLGYAAIEQQIVDFANRGREGKLTMDDLTGGTFSITNGGIFGSMLSTPILNPPQSAILGMHNIVERPMAENGQVVIRPMMYLALSYDHRLIDGRDAVQFLVHIKNNLEDPSRLLLAL
jgi:2-oxoglutarate dehydrogenase E2 component (dihydrolipoamide succinyltransferase)